MSYVFARTVIFIFRVLGYIVLMPSILAFLICGGIAIVTGIQSGFDVKGVQHAMTQDAQANKEDVKHAEDAAANTGAFIITAIIAIVAFFAIVQAVIVLAVCDMYKAIIESAI